MSLAVFKHIVLLIFLHFFNFPIYFIVYVSFVLLRLPNFIVCVSFVLLRLPISVFLFCLCLYFFLYDWFSLLVSCVCHHLFGCPAFVCFLLLQSFTWFLIIHLLIHIFVRYDLFQLELAWKEKRVISFFLNITQKVLSLYFLLGVATKSVPELQGFVKPSLEPGVSGRSK